MQLPPVLSHSKQKSLPTSMELRARHTTLVVDTRDRAAARPETACGKQGSRRGVKALTAWVWNATECKQGGEHAPYALAIKLIIRQHADVLVSH